MSESSRLLLGILHTKEACPDVVEATDKVGSPRSDRNLAFTTEHCIRILP